MWVLINDYDKSVNNAQLEQFPEWYYSNTDDKVIQKEITDITNLPAENRDDMQWIIDNCMLNPDNTSQLIEHEYQKLSEEELKSIIEEEQALETAMIANNTEVQDDRYDQIANLLKRLFPNNEEVQTILSDNQITDTELNQINSMLNEE